MITKITHSCFAYHQHFIFLQQHSFRLKNWVHSKVDCTRDEPDCDFMGSPLTTTMTTTATADNANGNKQLLINFVFVFSIK
jgi:hypothetical protein